MPPPPWPAFSLARARHGAPRVPFLLPLPEAAGIPAAPTGHPAPHAGHEVLGSVAVPDVDALRRFEDAFEIAGTSHYLAVVLSLPPETRDARLDAIHRQLRDEGRIVAWRDEAYPLRGRSGHEWGRVERASSRFWGLLTLGAHLNGYVADASGRPTHLWIARRSRMKPTDPGKLDNLVGGGVPAGQAPEETLVREGWEEAGLRPEDMVGRVAGSVIEIDADIPEGRQVEWLYVFDLALPPGWRPTAVDGEVDEHLFLTVDEALARAAAGEMTTDAALATLDFALRHGVAGPQAPQLAAALERLKPGR
jgi:8-oxo-dGTP pyrophosphatase MutT (NUDIX family)